MKLVREIHRRSLWQVLGIYLAASWIVLQVVDVVGNNFGMPEWVPPAALILLLVGLPIVLATAFVQEGVSGDPAPVAHSDPKAPATGPTDGPASAAHHRLFTWRNALVGGALAFVLLGLLTAGYLLMRATGVGPAGTLVAKGVLEEREPILVAEFESASGDTELATAATEALRIDLAQSPVLTLVDPSRVGEALARMGLEAGAPLTPDLAREVAQRDGINALVDGEITAAGRGYVLTARLLSAADGQVLASRRETAADSSEIITAIDKLSRGLRERIGESMGSLARTPDLEQVTTPSLKALRLYSQAERAELMEEQGDRAIALLEEAVAEDSTFAMAWRKLAVIRGNRGEQASLVYAASERAFNYRDRLPDRERYITIGTWYMDQGEWERSATAYESLLETQPDESFALHNLGVLYGGLRDNERAEDLYRLAYAADSAALSLHHLALTQEHLGKPEEADASFAMFRQRYPDNPAGPRSAAYIAVGRGDFDGAEREVESLLKEHSSSLYWRSHADLLQGALASTRGRLAEAAERLEASKRAQDDRGLPAEHIKLATDLALVRLLVAEDGETALAPVEQALERYPLQELDPLDRPYLELAAAYALAGHVARAKELMAEFERVVPTDRRGGWGPRDFHYPRAEIALAEGRSDDALEHLREADYGFCNVCALPGQARAYEMAGDTESAIAAHERYVNTPSIWRLGTHHMPWWPYGDWLFLGPTYERLGQLYDEQANLEKAAEYYAKFVELWAEADEELQPRVLAAQTRLEEIVRERG
jgi:tetratricopeptide (TPR) repeat protein